MNTHHKNEESGEVDRTETSGLNRVYFEKIERKQFKLQPTISKVAFNNSHNNTMYWTETNVSGRFSGREGESDKSSKRDVRQVAAGKNMTRRHQYTITQQ